MIPASAVVTVIMPVKNGERWLAEAIQSVLNQTWQNTQLLVVDDGSTDRTPAILRAHEGARVRVLRNDQSIGDAPSRNRALDEVRTPFIAFLDSDDVAESTWIESHLDVLHRDPAVCIVGSRVRIIDAHGKPTGAIWGHDGPADAFLASLLFRNAIAMSTIVMRREVLSERRFDHSTSPMSDYDMWSRVTPEVGIVCRHEPMVRYRVHGGGLTLTMVAPRAGCFEFITARQIAKLGLEPSERELTVHRRIGLGEFEASSGFVAEVQTWLKRLEDANDSARTFPAGMFARKLAAEWLAVCEATVAAGVVGTWLYVARCHLTRGVLRDADLRRRFLRLPLATMRGVIRRRFPDVKARLRWSQQRPAA